MKPTLIQCQVRVIFIGLLWLIPYLSLLKLCSSPSALVFLAGFPILIALLAAVLTGPFDLLAIVALLIPSAVNFVFSTHGDWVWHSRHAGTLLGSSSILDFLMVVAMVILALIGIALKRLLTNRWKVELSPPEVRSLHRCLFLDVGLLAGIVVVLLTIDAVKIVYENNPHVRAATEKAILTSPTATESDQLQVVMKLQYRRSPDDVDVLRQALKSPFPSVQQVAAAILLQRGDTSGLPVLEQPLMHSSRITITNPHQVIHHDWLGYGEGGPVSLTFNPGRLLCTITDPAFLPILTRLMSSTDPETQSNASEAVENVQLQKNLGHVNWVH